MYASPFILISENNVLLYCVVLIYHKSVCGCHTIKCGKGFKYYKGQLFFRFRFTLLEVFNV